MSDDPILSALSRLESGQAALATGQAKLETRLGKLEEGQAALATGQAKLETRLEKLEEGQAALATDQKSLRTDFLDELGKTRTDVMGKLAEVRSDLTGMRDDISVNMGAVDMVRQVNDNTRADVTQMREQISVMWKQLKQAQDDIRALKEGGQKGQMTENT